MWQNTGQRGKFVEGHMSKVFSDKKRGAKVEKPISLLLNIIKYASGSQKL